MRRLMSGLILTLVYGNPAVSGAFADDAFAAQHAIGSETSDASLRNRGDVFCGPRCVERILRYYGLRADLIDLIHEIQWPAIEQGSTLESLDAALKKRGLFTAALTVSSRDELVWPWPAVVYRPRSDGSAVGHFVVRLPSNEVDGELVWDGADGERIISRSELANEGTLIVLLTSGQRISDRLSVARPRAPFRAAIALSGGVFLVVFAALVHLLARPTGKRKLPTPFSMKGTSDV